MKSPLVCSSFGRLGMKPIGNKIRLSVKVTPLVGLLISPFLSLTSTAIARSTGTFSATGNIGASWTEVGAGLPRSPAGVRTVVVDPSSPSTIYALGGGLYALGGSLFKSTDGGGSWNLAGGVSSVSALV